MYYINDKGFSYLLYPKKYATEDNKAQFGESIVDMLYYYLNRGVPCDDMATPIYCTQEMVNQYGLDNLVMNMQRFYKYDYDIVVIKVPQEYMRMEPMFGNCFYDKSSKNKFNPKMLPLLCKYEFNGTKQDMLSADYIESVYLRYPDCRRIINDNWKLVSPDSRGMNLTKFQRNMLIANSNYDNIRTFDGRRQVMSDMDLTTRQMCDMCKNDESKDQLYGHDESVIEFIRDKYMAFEKDFPCRMTKSRIENLLWVETQRKNRLDRRHFLGE